VQRPELAKLVHPGDKKTFDYCGMTLKMDVPFCFQRKPKKKEKQLSKPAKPDKVLIRDQSLPFDGAFHPMHVHPRSQEVRMRCACKRQRVMKRPMEAVESIASLKQWKADKSQLDVNKASWRAGWATAKVEG